jgi:hypothetical protein
LRDNRDFFNAARIKNFNLFTSYAFSVAKAAQNYQDGGVSAATKGLADDIGSNLGSGIGMTVSSA